MCTVPSRCGRPRTGRPHHNLPRAKQRPICAGAQLSYDNVQRLTYWQYTLTSPTATADERYDGAGNRVVEQSTDTAPAYYLGGLEEVSGCIITIYYSLPGLTLSAMKKGRVVSTWTRPLQIAQRTIETANAGRLYGICGDAQRTNKERLSDALQWVARTYLPPATQMVYFRGGYDDSYSAPCDPRELASRCSPGGGWLRTSASSWRPISTRWLRPPMSQG
jgi:hypothetical protein